MPELARNHANITDEIGDIGEVWELLTARPAWHADAACREHPEIDWFPPAGGIGCRRAKAICGGCLALDDCRTWALAQGSDLQGVWGAMSARERQRVRTGRAAA